VQRSVSKGVEDRRTPALQAGNPRNGHKAVSGVARPQGAKGSGMAGPSETLGSPWIPLRPDGLPKVSLQPAVPYHSHGRFRGEGWPVAVLLYTPCHTGLSNIVLRKQPFYEKIITTAC
jgi:hypothetical protein